MSLTFIDTNTLSKKTTAGHGDVTEILTESLCGAHNVQVIFLLVNKGRILQQEKS